MIRYDEVLVAVWDQVVADVYQGGERPLVALFANDERLMDCGLAVYAIFADFRQGVYRGVKTFLRQDPWQIPSLVRITPAAAWYEREMQDLFGIVPVGHPDCRPLVLHENWPDGLYPLRKDFAAHTLVPTVNRGFSLPMVEGKGVFEVPVGPIHAGIIEPGHFRFSQAGEHIINLEAKLFFTHRGIEKAVEGASVETAFYQVERICGACTVSHALSYVQALENMVNMPISRVAQYMRVMAAELERLYNHVGDVGNLCAGLGFAVGISSGARMKEKLMRLNERVAGNRFLRGVVALGGVRIGLTTVISQDVARVINEVEVEFKELATVLREHEAFLDRVNTTGVVSNQAAIDLALVGVGARASGVSRDVRRDFPYGVYGELDFKVPVYHTGDVAARLWVRVDEVIESAALIRQVIEGMPEGDYGCEKLPPLAPYDVGLGWSESARGSNLHWLMTGENNTVYRLFVRSASYPNWPALAVAAPGNIIPDFPLINKSFELCYACIDR